MLTIIRCSNCGNEKNLQFTFEQEISKGFCKECKKENIETKIWRFCSFDCALDFINKIKTHKCGQYYKKDGGSINKDKSIRIYEQCSVCFNGRWRKIKGRELKRYLNKNPLMKLVLKDSLSKKIYKRN